MKLEGTTLEGRRVSVAFSGGAVEEVGWAREKVRPDPGQVHLGPGLVDLQVNGFAGVDFNRPGLAPAELEAACGALAATGVGSFFPTLITASAADLEAEAEAIREAVEASVLVRDMVAGIHLEGPFINPQDGPPGGPSPGARPGAGLGLV